jgi:RnfABCDGE-type electron transport complex G subunit
MADSATRVNKAYAAKDAAGNVIGYALNVTSKGFGGNVTLAMGLTADGRITGISFTELNETAGLGMKVDEPAFKDQFPGKGGKLTLVKGTASGEQEISAITGASVTSNAVVNAVNAGLDLYETALKGGN